MHRQLSSIRRELLWECWYCCAVVQMDYNNSCWKSLKRIIENITELIENAGAYSDNNGVADAVGKLPDALSMLFEAQKNRDLKCVADVIRLCFIPLLESIECADQDYLDVNLAAIENAGEGKLYDAIRNVNSDAGTHIVSGLSDTGDPFFILQDGDKQINLTSQTMQYSNALEYIFNSRKDDLIEYAFAGGGMIYEALALMKVNIDTVAYIIEEDICFLKLIFSSFDLGEYIASRRLVFIYRDAFGSVRSFVDKTELMVNQTSLVNVRDSRLKEIYERYRMIILSRREEAYLLNRNFHYNSLNRDPYVTDIFDTLAGKTVYIVAGGPSLDRTLSILQDRDEELSSIICVGTSARKLIQNGINPEYVIISDPLPAMKRQLAVDFDMERTSLIYLSSAHAGAVSSFSGKRYIVYQEQFGEAEELAKKEGVRTFLTGGSVSTLALDIALNTEADKIVCLGLDLAYTGNQMHASGVDNIDANEEGIIGKPVRGVSGQMVTTVPNLDSYRRWIVDRLKNYDGKIRLVNISDGAYIEGMENVPTEYE